MAADRRGNVRQLAGLDRPDPGHVCGQLFQYCSFGRQPALDVGFCGQSLARSLSRNGPPSRQSSPRRLAWPIGLQCPRIWAYTSNSESADQRGLRAGPGTTGRDHQPPPAQHPSVAAAVHLRTPHRQCVSGGDQRRSPIPPPTSALLLNLSSSHHPLVLLLTTPFLHLQVTCPSSSSPRSRSPPSPSRPSRCPRSRSLRCPRSRCPSSRCPSST
jgi:hypothetical protein